MTGTNTNTGDAVESAGRLDRLYRTYSPDALRVAYLLTGDRALYRTRVPFQIDHMQRGSIQVFEFSAENGEPLHMVEIPVTLLP